MTPLTLTRIDPVRNMRRYYRLDILPDLFGDWCCVREWGRLGRAGQRRSEAYATRQEAVAALDRLRGAKERRGYTALGAEATTAPTR